MANYYVIIVGGGTGTRMQSGVPKQFIPLNGMPVMMHTIMAFAASSHKPQIIVVLPANLQDNWASLCNQYHFRSPHQLVAGGKTRFHSVKNGLAAVANQQAIIAVQDAVRPLTTTAVIDNAFDVAAKNGTAVAAVKSRDSVRILKDKVSNHVNRDDVYLIQTPQTFKAAILKEAYEQEFKHFFTDDASVVEQQGYAINLIEGSYTNLKITYPEDIFIAETIQKKLHVK